MKSPEKGRPAPAPFTEKGFYLQEFRGRTVAFVVPGEKLAAPAPLAGVMDELTANRTRVVVISSDAPGLEGLLPGRVLAADRPGLEAAVWRRLRQVPSLGLAVPPERPFARACRELALALRVRKLVWLDPDGGLERPGGGRASFVDRAELRALLAGDEGAFPPRRRALLAEVDALLRGGIGAVNVCTLSGLADELFTYSGSGTLFTRDHYIEVRPLGIDDFDAAHDLHRRGTEEGYLAPRTDEEIDRVLASGFGAFVERRHLAGICALLVHAGAPVGEIASLYTLTRFLGEGVGAHLVAAALERAAALGHEAVFACTARERVGAFFLRQGFEPVAPDALPPEKWQGYDSDRRARLLCYRRFLG